MANKSAPVEIARQVEPAHGAHHGNASSPTAQVDVRQAAGNLAVQRLLRGGGIQAKLAVGQPGDVFEQEADRLAEQLTSGDAALCRVPTGCTGPEPSDLLQRKPSPRTAAPSRSAVASSLPPLGTGRPIEPGPRAFFEARLGQDLSQVRVHTGPQAAMAARLLNARAFASGSDVGFAPGEYAPDTAEGQTLVAHELVHVIQQSGTGVQPATPLGNLAPSVSAIPGIQRNAPEDVTRMSITPAFVDGLSEDDLITAARLLNDQLESLPSTTPESEVATANLNIIRLAASARGVDLSDEFPQVELGGPRVIASIPVVFEATPIIPGESGLPTSRRPALLYVPPIASLQPAEEYEPPPYAGPGLVSTGLSAHILASGEQSWLSRSAAARRLLSREYWAPFAPRTGQIQLERLLDLDVEPPSRLYPRIQPELAQLRQGTRTALTWERRFGFARRELESIPELIRSFNQGTISPEELRVLRRAAALHIGGSAPGSPLVSYMQPGHTLESVGTRRYRVRIQIQGSSVLDVSRPNVFNLQGAEASLTNIEEAELMLAADHRGRIISVEATRGQTSPGFLLRHSNKIRWGGRLLFVAGVAYSGYRIGAASPEERTRVVSEEVGGLALGAAGTVVAGAACVLLGIASGGIVLFACGLVGGAAGSALGTAAGSAFGRELEEYGEAIDWARAESPGSFYAPPGTVTLHGLRGGYGAMLRSPLDVVREMQAERR